MDWQTSAGGLWVASLLSVALGATTTAGENVPIRFQLMVPGQVEAGQGIVHLQSLTEPTTTQTLPLSSEVTLPPGEWSWQAEAPGWVSVGRNVTPAGTAKGVQVLKAQAMPSCTLDFLPEPRAKAFQRLWVVAVEASTTYRHSLPRPLPLAVPEGTFHLAGFGQAGLIGISGPHKCRRGEALQLPWPAPPDAESHALLMELVLPPEKQKMARREDVVIPEELLVTVQPLSPLSRERLARLDALVWTGPTAVALFPQVPAGPKLEWTLSHPALRSERGEIEPVGGGTTALEARSLRSRVKLVVPIDYQPLRRHRRALVQLYYCGRVAAPSPDPWGIPSCQTQGPAQTLRPGLQEYSFDKLDGGGYLLNAEIDDETVYGLGTGFSRFLRSEDDTFAEEPPQVVKELLLWGHVLRDGEPVPGEVRLRFTRYNQHLLRAPTDEELVYRAYFFGVLPPDEQWVREGLPEQARELSGEELRGLHGAWTLQVCAASGACRSYREGVVVVGGGRLDFELGPGAELSVRVVDGASGEPIEGVRVGHVGELRAPLVTFFEGRAFERATRGSSTAGHHTDAEGHVALWVPAGRHRVMAGKPGPAGIPEYLAQEQVITVSDGDSAELRFALDRVERGAGNLSFRLSDGRPLSGAALFVFTARGTQKTECFAPTRRDGTASLKEICLGNATVVLLHPQAEISFFDGNTLLAGGDFVVPPAPARPPVVLLRDSSGEPVAGAELELDYGGLVLSPQLFRIAESAARLPFLRPSDTTGRVYLVGVAPTQGGVARLVGVPSAQPLLLATASAGATVEWIVP